MTVQGKVIMNPEFHLHSEMADFFELYIKNIEIG
jgi:hypothetical protein